MEGLRVLKVGGVPEIVTVDLPVLPRRLQEEIELERQRIAASAHEFDGPVQVVLRADGDRLVVANATYAWWKVLRSTAGPNPYPWGGLGVALLLCDEQENILWARRSQTVGDPGVWGLSASGGAPANHTPYEAMLAETHEELGLAADALEGLQPLFTVRGAVTGGSNGILILYRARLAPGAVITANPEEVAETVWQPSPEGLEPFGASASLVWEFCRRRGFLDPRFLAAG